MRFQAFSHWNAEDIDLEDDPDKFLMMYFELSRREGYQIFGIGAFGIGFIIAI